jgi:hypothetical protein
MIFSATAFLFVIPFTEGLKLECDYKQASLASVRNKYTCIVDRVFAMTVNDITIANVSQNHQLQRINSDVRGFQMDNTPLKLIPRGLARFWPHLELIAMRNGAVEVITRTELVGLRNLRQLSMSGSKIMTITNNAFDGNPLINQINLFNNPVSNIGQCALEGLYLLTRLDMRSTKCMPELGATRNQVVRMVPIVVARCPPLSEPNRPRNCTMVTRRNVFALDFEMLAVSDIEKL